MKRIILVIFLVVIGFNAFADVTTEELIKKCEDKTIVMEKVDGEMQAVGEKLGGFCSGYFTGFISASSKTICVKDDDPNFILSVLKKHIKNTRTKMKQPAGETIGLALSKIYKCN